MTKYIVGMAASAMAALAALAGTGGLAETHSLTGAHLHADIADQNESTRAFIAVNNAMHAAMNMEFSGVTDVDFVRGMIPHHQGAIAMAQIVLEHGVDPEIRSLAMEIISAQEAEIAMMEAWLAAYAEAGPGDHVTEEKRQECRRGFGEVEGALQRTMLDSYTQGQVETLLEELDVAEEAGDAVTCQENIAEFRRMLHLDH